ncbi:MAG: glutamate--tRNA ligase family protein [Planctomycetota bacterium]
MPTPPTPTTRLAPSPTGALHLGNARTFLMNAALARQNGWRVALRIEDLDTPRVKPETIAETIDLLTWLGMTWDAGPTLQSDDLDPYRDAMNALAKQRLIYPCSLTRSEIEAAASAPHERDEPREAIVTPEMRPDARPTAFDDEHTNWRLAVEPGTVIRFDDRAAEPQAIDVAADAGDFVIWTKRGCPSYQLAVTADDARQGVTEIVRGNDLLGSAARQLLLWSHLRDHLSLGEPPAQTHLPLVRGEDGKRLAKRHGDTRLTTYRERGVPAEAVIGLIAFWSGVQAAREPMSAAAFFERFRLDTMPGDDVIFTEDDDRWLQSFAS